MAGEAAFTKEALESRWRAHARVVNCNLGLIVGDSVTYLNGAVVSNDVAVLALSGYFPLTFDRSRDMMLALARMTNSPTFDAEKLRRLESQPPARIISGEAVNPVHDLSQAFGANPLGDVVYLFGLEQIRMLREADRLEVFQVNPNDSVNNFPPVTAASVKASARPKYWIDGLDIVAEGRREEI